MLKKILNYSIRLRKADVNLGGFFIKTLYYTIRGKNIHADQSVLIRGLENIETKARLSIGVGYVPFLNGNDRTFLNIKGKLVIQEAVYVGKGSRIFVADSGTCVLEECAITGFTNFVIVHSLSIGKGSRIAWGCEFMDQDWHTIEYEGRKERPKGIIIGKRCWIGSHVKLLKGVRIPDDSVVACGAVVTGVFNEPNVLIAGNPARVIRRGIKWKP